MTNQATHICGPTCTQTHLPQLTEGQIEAADCLAEGLALLRAADVLWEKDDEHNERLIIFNDVWCWGSADCEALPDAEVPRVAELFKRYGWCGLLYWCSEKRGGCRSEFKDNNRFIDFVKAEEALVASVPDSNKRAYTRLTYQLGEMAP